LTIRKSAWTQLSDAGFEQFFRPDISNGRKDRVKAAVAKVSRLLRKAADQLPAHLPYLLRQLNRFKHESGSPQRKTVANTKSEIRFLVKTVIGKAKESEFAALSPIWADLRGRIPEPSILWKLSRFIAYCSVHGVAPQNVSDEIVENFRAELVACGAVKTAGRGKQKSRHSGGFGGSCQMHAAQMIDVVGA
jgi:hypothetical protein